MPKKTIRDVIHKEGTVYGEKLDDFISRLKEAASKAPYPDQVEISIDSYTEYDSSSPDVELYYYRLETDQEEQDRVSTENFWKNQRIAEAKKLLGLS